MRKKIIISVISVLVYSCTYLSVINAESNSNNQSTQVRYRSGASIYNGELFLTFPSKIEFSSNKTTIQGNRLTVSSLTRPMEEYGELGDGKNSFKIEVTATSKNRGLKENGNPSSSVFQYSLDNHVVGNPPYDKNPEKITDWSGDQNGKVIATYPMQVDDLARFDMGRPLRFKVLEDVASKMDNYNGKVFSDTITFGVKTLIINGKPIISIT